MIPVPDVILVGLADKMEIDPGGLVKFGGGRGDSDGVVYRIAGTFPERLVKVLAFPLASLERDTFRLTQRLQFMRFVGEGGVRVAYPLPLPRGNLFETAQDDRHCFVAYGMHLAPGKVVQEDNWDEAFLYRWGGVIGDMHRLARQYPLWDGVVAPSGERMFSWLEEWNSFYDWIPDEQVREQWLSLRRRLETLPIDRQGYGFTHNDPHHQNLLDDGEQMTLLDFDVANCHWFVNDLAIAGQGILFAQAGGLARPLDDAGAVREFYRSLLAGYRARNDLPTGWLQYLDWFIAYRRILLFSAMYGWLETQPEICRSWKQMILTEPQVVGSDPLSLITN